MKKNISLILLVSLTFFISNCKKQLDLKPTDTFTSINAIQSIADLQLGTNEAYGRYGIFVDPSDGETKPGGYLNDIYVNALLSDEAKIGSGNNGQGQFTYRYQYNSNKTSGGDVINAWGSYYALIDQVNRLLPYVPTVTATSAEEPMRNILKSQLLALRGIAYFGLLEAYSDNYDPAGLGVPVVTLSNPLGQPKRNTMGEVMDRITTDLADAKAGLPPVTAADFSDTVLNQVNIAAYQARIALYMKDYDAAVTYATEVINSGVKTLVSGSDFEGIWTDDNAYETLFRTRFETSDLVGTLWTTTGGPIYVAPSDKLLASYDAADIRLPAYIGDDGNGDHYVNKYYESSKGGRIVDMKACRISEMYLIRAEAYAKKSAPDLIAGATDLNLLRASRIAGYVDETFTSATELINAVLNERYKELAFEGFRFFDLKRNNLPVERLASDAATAWQTLASGSTLFVLPIPSDELKANPNVIQNPGY